VTAANLADYMAVPGVPAVGGTWLTPRSLLEAGDWAGITALAAAAVTAAGPPPGDAP
jgi:2-dehydro-3-deoxyphosphogluconate aldolase/(4S)-4-hydroxy-2-oxoglutarate aldolase